MESIVTVIASVVVLLFLSVPVMLVGSVLLVALAGPLLSAAPMLGRARFVCPVSKLTVNAQFTSWPGSEGPVDVCACSAFQDPTKVTCKKRCLELARTSAVSFAMVPRFALIAGGTAYRG
jgi:hypothetical protein